MAVSSISKSLVIFIAVVIVSCRLPSVGSSVAATAASASSRSTAVIFSTAAAALCSTLACFSRTCSINFVMSYVLPDSFAKSSNSFNRLLNLVVCIMSNHDSCAAANEHTARLKSWLHSSSSHSSLLSCFNAKLAFFIFCSAIVLRTSFASSSVRTVVALPCVNFFNVLSNKLYNWLIIL